MASPISGRGLDLRTEIVPLDDHRGERGRERGRERKRERGREGGGVVVPVFFSCSRRDSVLGIRDSFAFVVLLRCGNGASSTSNLPLRILQSSMHQSSLKISPVPRPCP